MAINFVSSEDSDKECVKHWKSGNIEIIIYAGKQMQLYFQSNAIDFILWHRGNVPVWHHRNCIS